MRVEDYYQVGRRSWLRLHEKRGKFHEAPAHHNAGAYLDAYLEVAGIATDKREALFRSTVGKTGRLTAEAMRILTGLYKKHRFSSDSVTFSLTSPKIMEEVEQMVDILGRAVQESRKPALARA